MPLRLKADTAPGLATSSWECVLGPLRRRPESQDRPEPWCEPRGDALCGGVHPDEATRRPRKRRGHGVTRDCPPSGLQAEKREVQPFGVTVRNARGHARTWSVVPRRASERLLPRRGLDTRVFLWALRAVCSRPRACVSRVAYPHARGDGSAGRARPATAPPARPLVTGRGHQPTSSPAPAYTQVLPDASPAAAVKPASVAGSPSLCLRTPETQTCRTRGLGAGRVPGTDSEGPGLLVTGSEPGAGPTPGHWPPPSSPPGAPRAKLSQCPAPSQHPSPPQVACRGPKRVPSTTAATWLLSGPRRLSRLLTCASSRLRAEPAPAPAHPAGPGGRHRGPGGQASITAATQRAPKGRPRPPGTRGLASALAPTLGAGPGQLGPRAVERKACDCRTALRHLPLRPWKTPAPGCEVAPGPSLRCPRSDDLDLCVLTGKPRSRPLP